MRQESVISAENQAQDNVKGLRLRSPFGERSMGYVSSPMA
jgi:hypothetical protein